jgi:TolA-binding protein
VTTAATLTADNNREVQRLLDRMTELSNAIPKHIEDGQSWRYQLEQVEVLKELAVRSKEEDRGSWLKMAVESCCSAVQQSPEKETAAVERLADMPGWIAKHYPRSPMITYAAMQEIRSDCERVQAKLGANHPNGAREHLCERLLGFAQIYPADPEAPKAVMEAAQTAEAMGKTDAACRSYRYLAQSFPQHALGRKAGGALWRLGGGGDVVQLHLPVLYARTRVWPRCSTWPSFAARSSSYFWSGTAGPVVDDMRTLSKLMERYQERGLEVVYVNLDSDAEQARTCLSGVLTAGTHVHQKGGPDGGVAEKYGISNLPHAFLVGTDGTLLKHTVPPAQLEAEVSRHFPRAGDRGPT